MPAYPTSGANVARCDLQVLPGFPAGERSWTWEDLEPPAEPRIRIGETTYDGELVDATATFDLPDLAGFLAVPWVLYDAADNTPHVAGVVTRWADGAAPSIPGHLIVAPGPGPAVIIRNGASGAGGGGGATGTQTIDAGGPDEQIEISLADVAATIGTVVIVGEGFGFLSIVVDALPPAAARGGSPLTIVARNTDVFGGSRIIVPADDEDEGPSVIGATPMVPGPAVLVLQPTPTGWVSSLADLVEEVARFTADTITENGLEHRRTLASVDPITLATDGDVVIAEGGTDDWDDLGLREPGAPIFDPVTETWICVYSGRDSTFAFSKLGAALSEDGETWEPHPDNPISGGTLGEDPYLAKAADGTLYRDSAGRALLFCEEKDGATHRGIQMWRSDPDLLTGWTLFGRVLDRGEVGTWDETDRTSPTVVNDGIQLIMLYEGRSLPTQEGMVGIARSLDEGETFTASAVPLVGFGAPGSWYERSIVPDDLIKVDDVWVLLAHGQAENEDYTCGRFATAYGPAAWAPNLFVPSPFRELRPGPITPVGFDTVMAFGNDPERAVWQIADQLRIARVASPFLVDGEAIDAKDADQDGRLDGHDTQLASHSGQLGSLDGRAGTLEGRADTTDGQITALGSRASALEDLTEGINERFVPDQLGVTWHGLPAVEVAETAPGTDVDTLASTGNPLDGSSDLDPAGGITIVTSPYTAPYQGAVWSAPAPPLGHVLLGVRLVGLELEDVPGNVYANVGLIDGGFTAPNGAVVSEGDVFRGNSTRQWPGPLAGSHEIGDVAVLLDVPTTDALMLVVTLGLVDEDEPTDPITARLDAIEWLFVADVAAWLADLETRLAALEP